MPTLSPFPNPNPINKTAMCMTTGEVVALNIATLALGTMWMVPLVAAGSILLALTGPRFSPLTMVASKGWSLASGGRSVDSRTTQALRRDRWRHPHVRSVGPPLRQSRLAEWSRSWYGFPRRMFLWRVCRMQNVRGHDEGRARPCQCVRKVRGHQPAI